MLQIDITKLKEAIDVAENKLEEIKDSNAKKDKRKVKRVNKALEKAYATLNLGDYTQDEVDKRTDDIWIALSDDDHYMMLLLFIIGIFLSGAFVFAVYQAYSYIKESHDRIEEPTGTDPRSLIDVTFEEKKIVSLYNQLSVDDEIGLENDPTIFTISNDASKAEDLEYSVPYIVYLIPMNDSSTKLIDKKYIRYRYTTFDHKTGETYTSKIGNLSELPTDGEKMILVSPTQAKGETTDYTVTFWIGSDAENDQQGASYTFGFEVSAWIATIGA